MELPFTVVFEPPSRAELRALLRMRGHWVAGSIVALAIGAAYVLANVAHADAHAAALATTFELRSRPSGAGVWIDGHQRGTTPLQLSVEIGVHSVLLKSPGARDGQYSVDVDAHGGALDAVLWRQQPSITRLRPALPGAVLEDVRLLADGSLGLSVRVPPGRELQAWRLDPSSGESDVMLDEGIVGARLTFTSDGQSLAYLGYDIGPWPRDASMTYGTDAPPLTVMWLALRQPSGVMDFAGWRAPLEPGEQLADVSWSPSGDRLLVLATRQFTGDLRRTRAWFVERGSDAADPALSIPSEIVAGTESWSPDGQHVAFIARAGQVNALCLLGLDGSFRYVADLDASPSPPPAYPRVTWSADSQRMLFVAPHQHLPGVAFDWLQPETQHAEYLAKLDQPTPVALADTPIDQVTWREDGQVLGLWRPNSDSTLSIRLLGGAGGSGQGLLDVPLKLSGPYAAMWDMPHGNVVIASRDPAANNAAGYWLVRLGLESEQS